MEGKGREGKGGREAGRQKGGGRSGCGWAVPFISLHFMVHQV